MSPDTHFLKQEGRTPRLMSAQPEASAQQGGYRIGWIWELQEAGSVALRGTKASPEGSLDRVGVVGGNSYQGEGESGTAVLASEPTISRA